MDTATIREWATDAIRYWEPRRVVYNAVLAAIVITYFAIGLPSSKQLLNLNFVLFLFLLAVLANVCYCAAYLVDIFAQTSGFRELWQRYRSSEPCLPALLLASGPWLSSLFRQKCAERGSHRRVSLPLDAP